ncbi:MAG: hypothetical protein WEG36_03660 [Gemmatimonadota bacterium]
MRTLQSVLVAAMAAFVAQPGTLPAQDLNVPLPTDSIEHLLAYAPFEPPAVLIGTRSPNDRTQRVELLFEDGTVLLTKWAPAPRGGNRFNNVPRYEIAAYEIQKLFLDEPDFVVPPTVPRIVSLEWYEAVNDDVDPTFSGAASVLVVLQYFLYGVTDEGVFDLQRFEADSLYARHWANANLFTHLIWHSDSNPGNLLISTFDGNPRVFSVDNGVAFRSPDSNRGTEWRTLHVNRFPGATVERLRGLSEARLRAELGVLAQFEIVDGELVRVGPAANLDPGDGVREEDGVVQIGLTDREISEIWNRIEAFLARVDQGRLTTF